jgi:hypothetical protein
VFAAESDETRPVTQNEFAHFVESLASLSREQMRQVRRELGNKRAAAKANLPDRACQQREALQQLREKLDVMPAAEHGDGPTILAAGREWRRERARCQA